MKLADAGFRSINQSINHVGWERVEVAVGSVEVEVDMGLAIATRARVGRTQSRKHNQLKGSNGRAATPRNTRSGTSAHGWGGDGYPLDIAGRYLLFYFYYLFLIHEEGCEWPRRGRGSIVYLGYPIRHDLGGWGWRELRERGGRERGGGERSLALYTRVTGVTVAVATLEQSRGHPAPPVCGQPF